VSAASHIVDSSINRFGLTALAHTWAVAPASDQGNLLRVGDMMLSLLGGTWASVISYFHGVPFILSGLAVVFSQDYPAWLGWAGVVGGTGSLIAGSQCSSA
jgi:hypothetical protein